MYVRRCLENVHLDDTYPFIKWHRFPKKILDFPRWRCTYRVHTAPKNSIIDHPPCRFKNNLDYVMILFFTMHVSDLGCGHQYSTLCTLASPSILGDGHPIFHRCVASFWTLKKTFSIKDQEILNILRVEISSI